MIIDVFYGGAKSCLTLLKHYWSNSLTKERENHRTISVVKIINIFHFYVKILDFTYVICYTHQVKRYAGVVQWQNTSLPSWLRGSDSLHLLHRLPQLSWIEQCPSKAEVEGSNPSGSTNLFFAYGGLSSVGRTPDCGSGGQGFDPLRSPHIQFYWGVAKW